MQSITYTLKFGRPALYMDDLLIPNVSECSIFICTICQKNCDLDVKRQMRKFYANANCLNVYCRLVVHIKLQVILKKKFV